MLDELMTPGPSLSCPTHPLYRNPGRKAMDAAVLCPRWEQVILGERKVTKCWPISTQREPEPQCLQFTPKPWTAALLTVGSRWFSILPPLLFPTCSPRGAFLLGALVLAYFHLPSYSWSWCPFHKWRSMTREWYLGPEQGCPTFPGNGGGSLRSTSGWGQGPFREGSPRGAGVGQQQSWQAPVEGRGCWQAQ